MNLDELMTFLEVASVGNINTVCNNMHISRSAASRRIASLEQYLGYALFHHNRGSRTMTLTPEGKSFFPIAQEMVSLDRKAQGIAAKRQANTLSILTVDSIQAFVLASLYEPFFRQYPDISLKVRSVLTPHCIDFVKDGSSDIAFVPSPDFSETVDAIPFYIEPIVFICKQASSYGETVDPATLDYSKHLRFVISGTIQEWYKKWFGACEHPCMQADRITMPANLISTSLSQDRWSLVPLTVALSWASQSDIVIRKLTDDPPARIIYYLIRKQSENLHRTRFLEAYKRYIRSIPELSPLF